MCKRPVCYQLETDEYVTIDVQSREIVPTRSLAKLCFEEDGTSVHLVICKQTNCLGTDYAFSQKQPRIQKVPGSVWASPVLENHRQHNV